MRSWFVCMCAGVCITTLNLILVYQLSPAAPASQESLVQTGNTIPHALARPEPNYRTFVSSVIDNFIDDFTAKLKDPQLATLFRNCFPNTLDTTVRSHNSDIPDTYIITGDIDAMWLRDSTNQVLPYMAFAAQDPKLENMLCGLMHRQASNVLIDPYANAFNQKDNGNGHQDDLRTPEMKGHVFEGKYELDSLAAFLKLSYSVYNWTGKSLRCVERKKDNWFRAVNLAFETIKAQQAGSNEEIRSSLYKFQRLTTQATDTLMMGGIGAPSKRCGLSKSPFRGSDDSVTLPFQIAANAMAVVELRHVAEMLSESEHLFGNAALDLAANLKSLATEIDDALRKHGVMKDPADGRLFFAYEVDGFGGQYFMDDANIPGLLSLPYLGYCNKSDPVYKKTRELVLSERNPYFFKGLAGEGVGGPHIGLGYIWPMGVLTRAITSDDDQEILESLDTIKGSSIRNELPFMHESFWKDDAMQYTRPWFAWANTLFGEVMLTLARERPHLIFK
eukprot:TRINITY_DN25462_c0_g1_i2.p1 TRINITY_DN25462_c0_g1~~TRINITY_DN25462_c0_g1_i2.p1  ORF type:complete len:504 (+),score=74.29 TRINITY_DN25462_c0_g1_i2:41-1552(+)